MSEYMAKLDDDLEDLYNDGNDNDITNNDVKNTKIQTKRVDEEFGQEFTNEFFEQYQETMVDNNIVPKLEKTESGKLLANYLAHVGFGKHLIDVTNHWYENSAAINILGRCLTLPNGNVITFENLMILLPTYFSRNNSMYPLTPQFAREQEITYGNEWYVDVVLKKSLDSHEVIDRVNNVCIGTVPTMLKSKYCNLRGKTREELALLGEDPDDAGGYYIVKGVEKIVLLQEQLTVNKIFVMKINSKDSVVTRMTANTSRGTALIELVMGKPKKISSKIPSSGVMKIRFSSLRGPKKVSGKSEEKNVKYRSFNVMDVLHVFSDPTFLSYIGVTDEDDVREIQSYVSDVDNITKTISFFIKPEHVQKTLYKFIRNTIDFIATKDLYKSEIIPESDTSPTITKFASKMQPEVIDKVKDFKDKLNNIYLEIKRVFETDLFPHINVSQIIDGETPSQRAKRIAMGKIFLLSIMTARFLEYNAGFRPLDNRDSWSNKRVESGGRMCESLLRTVWRHDLKIIQNSFKAGKPEDFGAIVEKIRKGKITETFESSFISNKWGIKRSQVKNNVAQTLVRDSVPATFAHINTVDVSISRTDKQQPLRLVQNSQYGLICPASTPEGENSGLLKNLAITAKVSIERDDKPLIRALLGDEQKGLETKVHYAPFKLVDNKWINVIDYGWDTKLIVNGKFLGWCNGDDTKKFLLNERRAGGVVDIDVSIIKIDDWLYVDGAPSRLIRPLLIVDEDQQLVFSKLDKDNLTIDNMLKNGAMEYISAWEQEYIKIASSVDVINKRNELLSELINKVNEDENNYNKFENGEKIYDDDGQEIGKEVLIKKYNESYNEYEKFINTNKPYTHCELHKSAMLGVVANLAPWPNHNQAPRNTYQAAMGKQALGEYHPNHKNRFDGKMKTLAFPTPPLVTTDMYDILNLNSRGPGVNTFTMVTASPFTEEDAFQTKREFLDSGGFRMYKYFTYKTLVKEMTEEYAERLKLPNLEKNDNKDRYRYITSRDSNYKGNGLPQIGAPLKQGDCVIAKVQISNKEETNESVYLRVGDEGIVDKVLVTSDGKISIVTVKLRIMRVPMEGDKFAPRNAQKGTIGLVLSDIYLPATDKGITPDFVINVHSWPSRLTLSYPMELYASKVATQKCTTINGGAFQPFDVFTYRQYLKQRKIDEYGNENMRSRLTGKQIPNKINCSHVYFQALKHHVLDKYQSRSMGTVKPVTRQPLKGRGNKGGLRFGEMERDVTISHGASSCLRERLMYASDAYATVFCINCGNFAVATNSGGYKNCRLCGGNEFGKATIPYAYKLLIHLLSAPGIRLYPIFKELKDTKQTEKNLIDAIKENLEDVDLGFEEENEEYEAIFNEDANDLDLDD